MAVKRQDAWSSEDDMILAEVTLRHIRDGGTQLSAFEEVAEKLGRTPAACGFRWNSSVRKNYEAAIQVAKTERQRRSQDRSRYTTPLTLSSVRVDSVPVLENQEDEYSLDHVIRFLRQHKNEVGELKKQQKQLEQELFEREDELRRLEKENRTMKEQLTTVESDYQLVNDDYRTLVQIMERARRLATRTEELDKEHK
ncbi:RsfA family transcriptional regulator [Shimazuella alba]|uniref:RsfA family transcriptional regulator n=1 Tax=Shimazuella alba TaxID=2690964 RepID=A0A6I4VZJ0_9BACL|nr:RsfA family transcriptional regulator [Shimazuella alba]MXQ55370.1 RsfA family transcriptional regulator [Shimazuella alba]